MSRYRYEDDPQFDPREGDVTDMTAPVPSDIDGPAEVGDLIERNTLAADRLHENGVLGSGFVEELLRSNASALTAYQARLNTSKINQSTWEDSARINKGRAEAAEAKVAALTKEINSLGTIVTGLKTTIERMEASALRDKELIKELRSRIYDLQWKLNNIERVDW